MALAVHAGALGRRATLMLCLVVTMVLGAVFLGIKAVEYYQKFVEHHVPGATFHFEGPDPAHAQIFFSLYFMMTGLHALHMVVGLGLMAVMLFMAWRSSMLALV
jgi:cytochrome c oxidase subunit 3